MGSDLARVRVPSRRKTILLGQVLFVLLALAVWQYADGRWVKDFIISSPVHVVARLIELFGSGSIWPDIWVTTQELLIGYGLGVTLGVATGLVLGAWATAGALFEPLITAINGVPKVALAPLFLLWLGLGIWSKVAIASMTVFFVMFYNTYLGMKTVPQGLVDMVRLMGGDTVTTLREVVLPAIAVPVLAGLRASVPFAMIGVVVGEFIASDVGVGYYIHYSTNLYDSAGLYSGILILLAMILIGNGLLGLLQARVLRWQRLGRP